jgi:DNA-binding PadR family transcriptional regulator
VAPDAVESGRGPRRTIYTATPQGREAVTQRPGFEATLPAWRRATTAATLGFLDAMTEPDSRRS